MTKVKLLVLVALLAVIVAGAFYVFRGSKVANAPAPSGATGTLPYAP